jgi:hypothetical protein
MKGHKDEVWSLSVHPTGSLALSTSKDRCAGSLLHSPVLWIRDGRAAPVLPASPLLSTWGMHVSSRMGLLPRSVRLWDLAKARCAHHRMLPTASERVQWAPDGESYALLINQQARRGRRVYNRARCALTQVVLSSARSYIWRRTYNVHLAYITRRESCSFAHTGDRVLCRGGRKAQLRASQEGIRKATSFSACVDRAGRTDRAVMHPTVR